MISFGMYTYKQHVTQYERFWQAIPTTPVTLSAKIVNKNDLSPDRYIKQKVRIRINDIHSSTFENNTNIIGNDLLLYLKKPIKAQVDDTIQIYNLTLKKSGNEAFNTFLQKERVAGSACLQELSYAHISHPYFSLMRTIAHIKKRTLSQLANKLSRPTCALFSAMFLGNTHTTTKEYRAIKNNFLVWGITHYLARSGLHLIIFLLIWSTLCNFLQISYIYKQFLLIMISSLYFILSWPTISFIRAFLLLLLYKACSIAKVPNNLLHLLSLITLFTLWNNPIQLFFLDFQLSFGLTGALSWLNLVERAQKQHK